MLTRQFNGGKIVWWSDRDVIIQRKPVRISQVSSLHFIFRDDGINFNQVYVKAYASVVRASDS